ncbi:hypothetical protein ATY30_11375 [Sinorhizobium americanum]|nr:hypothetical protein ATY30_11375 [Sinorhizobium americanum]
MHQLKAIWGARRARSMASPQIFATDGCAYLRAKKEGHKKTWALVVVKVIRTSRGEQLLRWHWEEKPPKMHQLDLVCCFFERGAII